MREDSGEAAPPLPPSVRLLQWLVIAMTATMIGGVITVVAVVVTRMPRPAPPLTLPAGFALPAGVEAEAVTFGRGFVAVVTRDARILVLDPGTGVVRQEIAIEAAE